MQKKELHIKAKINEIGKNVEVIKSDAVFFPKLICLRKSLSESQ